MVCGNKEMNMVERKWTKPPEGHVKINYDASGVVNGSVGVGCVVRDSQGSFVGARCCRIEGEKQPREAGALSLKEALSWVKSLGYKQCIFETDSHVVAMTCKNKRAKSYFHTIVLDGTQSFKHFDHVLVEFVFRSANRVTHLLASAAHSMSDLGEWYVTPPDFLNHVLEIDIL